MSVCYLGLGSNLGNRRAYIKSAVRQVRSLKKTKLIKASKIIESSPVGGPPGQGNYLNAVIKIETSLAPLSLLKELKKIEHLMGRRKTVRNGPRTIDLDILFYGDRIMNSRGLKLPHPRVFEREFVIRPLLEVI